MLTIKEIVQCSLGTLNSVTNDLIKGVTESDLISRYRGKNVVPGVTIRQHLMELKNGGCLRHEGDKIFLKDECNPIKLLAQ